MEQSLYPTAEFENITRSAWGLVEFLLKPYHDAIFTAPSVEALSDWIVLVIPEDEDFVAYLSAFEDVNEAKTAILSRLASYMIEPADETSTAWDISANRDAMSIRLFGESTDLVEVSFRYGPNTFLHKIDEEFTCGNLVVIEGAEGEQQMEVYVCESKITLEDFNKKFELVRESEEFYVASTNHNVVKEVVFQTSSFVDGIINASEWLNDVDPRQFILSIVKTNSDESTVPYTFEYN